MSRFTRIEMSSSHGILVCREDGYIIHDESEIASDSYLETIKKIDIEEVDRYLTAQGMGVYEGVDIQDVGYWDWMNRYHKPSYEWRLSVFHSPELEEKEVRAVVRDSYKWIKLNRYGK